MTLTQEEIGTETNMAPVTTVSQRTSWFSPRNWLKWRPTSLEQLEKVEQKILSCCDNISEKLYVKAKDHKIWTVILNKEKEKERLPIVMVHGFGGGVGLWVHNLDVLSDNRTVYAFDLLGFGRSARPSFNSDPSTAESEFVDTIEEWRKSLKIDKFILMGHSLGAFLASCYSIKYPDNVRHLILADPWGFPDKPPANQQQSRLPGWIRLLVTVLTPFNPLAGLRAAGPWGPGLVKRFRPDLRETFSEVFDDDTIFDYIYHCNAQKPPSGETAFRSMTIPFGWAKFPMINRVSDIASEMPVTFIYGSRSWIDRSVGYRVKYIRNESYVDVQVIQGAGHHVYADRPDQFNRLVELICNRVDNSSDKIPDIIKPDKSTDDKLEKNRRHSTNVYSTSTPAPKNVDLSE